MHIVLTALGILFILASFVGFIGGFPAIIFWALAALCIWGAWKTSPKRRARRGGSDGPDDRSQT